MEAVSRMSRMGNLREEKESNLPACLGLQVSSSPECKVRSVGWGDDTKEAVKVGRPMTGVQLNWVMVCGRMRGLRDESWLRSLTVKWEGGGRGTEVGGTQIDNLEYSLSQSCNCAILPTEGEGGNKRTFLFSLIFLSSSCC